MRFGCAQKGSHFQMHFDYTCIILIKFEYGFGFPYSLLANLLIRDEYMHTTTTWKHIPQLTLICNNKLIYIRT